MSRSINYIVRNPIQDYAVTIEVDTLDYWAERITHVLGKLCIVALGLWLLVTLFGL